MCSRFLTLVWGVVFGVYSSLHLVRNLWHSLYGTLKFFVVMVNYIFLISGGWNSRSACSKLYVCRVYVNISFLKVFYLIGQAHCQGLTLEITLCREWLLPGNQWASALQSRVAYVLLICQQCSPFVYTEYHYWFF